MFVTLLRFCRIVALSLSSTILISWLPMYIALAENRQKTTVFHLRTTKSITVFLPLLHLPLCQLCAPLWTTLHLGNVSTRHTLCQRLPSMSPLWCPTQEHCELSLAPGIGHYWFPPIGMFPIHLNSLLWTPVVSAHAHWVLVHFKYAIIQVINIETSALALNVALKNGVHVHSNLLHFYDSETCSRTTPFHPLTVQLEN